MCTSGYYNKYIKVHIIQILSILKQGYKTNYKKNQSAVSTVISRH